jgi:hypothetical protein
MKRAFAGILCCFVFATAALCAADAVTLAAQEEIRDNYKRLSAMVDELQAAQLALQKQVGALATEVGKLRDEIAHANNNSATQESMRKLDDQIRKVDESRVSDNKRIQEALEKLGRAIREIPAAPSSRPRVVEPGPAPAPSGAQTGRPGGGTAVEDGFEYAIQDGDRLDKIVTKLREQKIMVTSKMIRDANPTVDWNRLKVNQKIFIPKPK